MIKESRFNKRLRTELTMRGFKFDRIESHATAPGIPDNAWVHVGGNSGWLEIKESENQPSRIIYRPRQALWLYDHWERNGNCATILHVITGDHVFIIPGRESIEAERDFASLLINLPGIFIPHLVLSIQAWDQIARILIKLRYR